MGGRQAVARLRRVAQVTLPPGQGVPVSGRGGRPPSVVALTPGAAAVPWWDVPSGPMDPADRSLVHARRELVLVAVVLVTLARLVPPVDAFLVAGMLPAVMLLAGIGVVGSAQPGSRPFEALLVPATLTGGAGAAIHLVPIGLGIVPALIAFAALLDRALALEMRLAAEVTGATETDRSRVLLVAVVTAFVAFTGIAARRYRGAGRCG
jgi:hypothetical protein